MSKKSHRHWPRWVCLVWDDRYEDLRVIGWFHAQEAADFCDKHDRATAHCIIAHEDLNLMQDPSSAYDHPMSSSINAGRRLVPPTVEVISNGRRTLRKNLVGGRK